MCCEVFALGLRVGVLASSCTLPLGDVLVTVLRHFFDLRCLPCPPFPRGVPDLPREHFFGAKRSYVLGWRLHGVGLYRMFHPLCRCEEHVVRLAAGRLQVLLTR
jgi:hypothetical protein